MAKKKRTRTLKRDLERAQGKLAKDRRKLIALEPGGSAQRPIEVNSAAIIELRAESFACPDCQGSMRAEEHQVDAALHVRVVQLRCRRCASALRLYFRIVVRELN